MEAYVTACILDDTAMLRGGKWEWLAVFSTDTCGTVVHGNIHATNSDKEAVHIEKQWTTCVQSFERWLLWVELVQS